MGEKSYPLEAARTVRAIARDRAAEELAEAIEAHEAARARTSRAAERLRASRQRVITQPDDPACSAAALQRVERYRERLRDEEATLLHALERAQSDEDEAAREVGLARDALERAEAEREVIERHRDRWATAQKEGAERAAEDEQDDFSARFRDP